jgi:transposase
MVERARIVLACLEGEDPQQIGSHLGVSVWTVREWRRRFAQHGLPGLRDRPRTGKPPFYDAGFRDQVLALLERSPPDGRSHWDGRTVAASLGASVHAVWRVLRKEGIYLERHRSWSVNADFGLVPKTLEVSGLYLNPPLNAVILSLGETPCRLGPSSSGYVETHSRGAVQAMRGAYRRSGRLSLVAALEISSRDTHVHTSEEQQFGDFRRFLDGIATELPSDLEIHAILDSGLAQQRHGALQTRYLGRVQFHLTPDPASWLSQVEICFSLLARHSARGGSSAFNDELRSAIEDFITTADSTIRPFQWRKRAVDHATLKNRTVRLCN